MTEIIEIDMDIDPIEFDSGLPVELAKITDKGIERAVILPNGYPDRHLDFQKTLTPISFSPCNTFLVAPLSFPEDQDLKSNRRLKLGKIFLPIPDGFFPGQIADACQQQYGINPSGRLRYMVPNDIHLNLVVAGINELNCDQFSKRDLTFSLRNKNVKAKDIENVLGFLVDRHGALLELESMGLCTSTVGRRPSQKYQVLWGQSQFFTQKPQKQITEESTQNQS